MNISNGSRILQWLLESQGRIDTTELVSVAAWKERFDKETQGWNVPIDHAVIGGFLADRTAYAFAAGYECALRRLVPSLPERTVVSFCVTEEKGGHPSAIRSSLKKGKAGPWVLNGGKKFVTLATEAELLLIAASTGTASDGKNMLRIAMVSRNTPGVEVSAMAGLPFVPEISHGTVALYDVPVEERDILIGDGYAEYIRPFRTIEDLHIECAVLAHLFRIGCLYGWPRAVKERIAAVIACARALSLDNPSSPALHIALGGLNAQMASLIADLSGWWETVDEKTRAAWERDSALLRVAEKARSKRLETAWSRF
ncbi:MAG: acyl-CoA dehydrogenase family protein [Spirochaetes bacterium]|nr:acyl-CoA dehydrogenase family protein [Spirochaetota bacterium]